MPKDLWSLASSGFSTTISLAGVMGLRKMLTESKQIAQQIKQSSLPLEKMPEIAVLVPARNEERVIKKCLESILRQELPSKQVIVINDRSEDNTEKILREIENNNPDCLNVIDAQLPQEGWLGKPNALWQGFRVVNPQVEWVLFVDADTYLAPHTIVQAATYAINQNLDLFSFAPRVKSEKFLPRLVLPEILKFYTLLHGNPLKPPDPTAVEEASAVGAFILVRRKAYDRVGGHEVVKHSVIEDIDLAQAFRKAGFKTQQTPGFEFVEVDWYQNFSQVWEGTGKNLFLVAQKKWSRVAFVLVVEWLYGLLPFLQLLVALLKKKKEIPENKITWYIKLLAAASVTIFYGYNSRQLGVPFRYGLLYPVSCILSSAILLYSALRIGILRSVKWKGRKIKV